MKYTNGVGQNLIAHVYVHCNLLYRGLLHMPSRLTKHLLYREH